MTDKVKTVTFEVQRGQRQSGRRELKGAGMTTAERDVRLKKIETRAKRGCEATYAVVVDGKTEGYVDKYVHEEVTKAGGQRSERSTRTAKYTTWGQRRPGTLEEPPGCSRRQDAVDRLIGRLGDNS